MSKKFSLEKEIVNLSWNSPLDSDISNTYKEDPLFGNLIENLSILNPYIPSYDEIFEIVRNKIIKNNKDLSKEHIGEAYSSVHFFVQIQFNIGEIVTGYKGRLDKLDYIIEMMEVSGKLNLEGIAKNKITTLYDNKVSNLEQIRMKYSGKEKISTIESKFLQNSLSNEDKQLEAKISFLTGQKLNNYIYNKIKADTTIGELRRKRLILKSALEYSEKLFKVVQEQINGYKKIIDNLVFLYNNNGGGK